MKKTRYLFALLFLLRLSLWAQVDTSDFGTITPGGYLDTLYDQHGEKHLLRKYSVSSINSVSCTAGYFNIVYANNSGFEQLANPVHTAKRDILCKLFTDISNFIHSPLSAPGNTVKVNILIGDPTNALTQNPGFRGAAASFYVAASMPSSPNPGIVDSEIYKTIISGFDSYTNVAPPLTVFNGNNFFHGMMIFNPNVSWNLNLNSATMTNQNDADLWSVALHEICHLLGFSSTMSFGGVSVFGPNNNYFSRYDKFLHSSAGVPLLSSTNTACFNLNASYTAPTTLIAPASCSNSPSDLTTCNTAVRYIGGSANVAVFTPSCWMSGSSLSHFEDICSTPMGFSSTCTASPPNNNLYFLMANAGGTGDCYIQRHLKPEERSVLCDLGYSVAAVFNPASGTTYPSSVTPGAAFNYTNGCSGDVPLGINDGLNAGGYIYASNTTVLTFPINAIIGNDVNTTTLTCVEPVYNNGVVTVAGNMITFVASPGVGGPILLRYLPVNANGVSGNITYIHGFITPAACSPPNACDMIQNGGFESSPGSFNCGVILGPNTPDCWTNTAINSESPDYYSKNNCNVNSHTLGGNMIIGFHPLMDTHNPTNPNNQRVVGMTASTNIPTIGPYLESLKNYLSAPLVPNQVYVLSCWLYNYHSMNPMATVNALTRPMVIRFLSDQNYGSAYTGSTLPGTLNPIATFTTSQLNGQAEVNKWIPYQITFTFTSPGAQNHNVVYFGIDAIATDQAGAWGPTGMYAFIDDISLLPVAQAPTVTLPSTVACTASSFADLSQYVQPSNGSFSGPGVTFSGGLYSFNTNYTLTPGTHGITYTYTTSLGCVQNHVIPITILPASSPVTFSLPPYLCQSAQNIPDLGALVAPSLYSSAGVFTGPGLVTSPTKPPVYSLNGANAGLGLHTYTYSYPSCGIHLTATTSILPPFTPSITNALGNLCLTPLQSTTLTATSNSTGASYTWTPSGSTGNSLVVTPASSIVYTLTAQSGLCVSTETILLTVVPPATFVNLPANLCTSTQFFYLENLLAPGSPTGGGWSVPGLPVTTVNATHHEIYIPAGTAPGNYTLSYIYTAPSGCSLSAQFTTNVLMTPTVSTNGPLYHCTNIPGYASTLIATSTSTLPMSYTWNPGNLSGASVTVIPTNTNMVTDYSVVATDGTCTSQPAILVMGTSSLCCGTATSATAFNYLNTSVSTTTLSGLYAINQNLTIQGNVTLDGEFYIAPHVSITVGPMASLHTRGGYIEQSGAPYNHHAHLLSCYDMWEGIYVDHLGQVEFEEGDLIEDARVAITSKGSQNPNTNPISYDIILNDVVFNRNDVGVAIKDFTLSTGASPFQIRHCVFTSRDLPFTTQVNITGKPTWPDAGTLRTVTNFTNPMAPPSDLGGYTPLNLKAPYQNHPPTAGVLVENSGITQSPMATNPTYHAIIIGSTQYDGSGFNIFDNLSAGIFSKNSNVSSFGNVFQNTRNSNSLMLYGAGIRALNNETNPLNYNSYLNLVTPVNASTNPNYFYDCHVGIDLNRVFQANVQYAEMRSTRDVQNSSSLLRGVYGLFIKGNRFKNYAIQNNQFLNLNFGVLLETDQGPFDLGSGQSGYGQVWGTVNIRHNLFSSAPSAGASPGNGSMNIGVYAHNILYTRSTAPLGAGYYTVTPNNGLRIQENDFDQVYRGVYVRNFSNSLFGKFTANNRIQLVQDQIAPAPSPQWGVNYENNYFGVVNTNTVSGFGPLASASLTGVYFAMNNNSSAQCNSVVTLSKGMEFAGLNFGALWRTNIFHNNSRGMQLSSNGIIGQQGAFNNPSDNVWFGSTWVGTNYNTWTDMNSDASFSKIARRTLTGYNPLNNNGFFIADSWGNTSNLINANNAAPYPPCVPLLLPTKGPNTSKSQLAGNISANSISYQGNYTAETEEINHLLLFRELEEDDTLRISDPGIETFYDGGYYAEAGTLMQIEQYLSEGNFSSAAALLASFSPTSAIQTNYQVFYELYLKFSDPLGTGLDAAEASALAALAQKCPFIDGAVIYQARSLLQRATGNPVFYNDEGCDITEDHFMNQEFMERKAAAAYLLAEERSESYQLFPNPATDRVYVISPREEETLRFQIRDLSDKLLAEETIQVRNFQAELKLNLINGLYFVTLVNQDHEQVVKKLVISK